MTDPPKRVAGLPMPAGYEPPETPTPTQPRRQLVERLPGWRCVVCGFISPKRAIVDQHVAEQHPDAL